MEFWIVFFASVFVLASLAGIGRCVFNGDFKSISHLAACGIVSGIVGIGLVAIRIDDISGSSIGIARNLGWGVLIGLIGPEVLVAIKGSAGFIVRLRIGEKEDKGS